MRFEIDPHSKPAAAYDAGAGASFRMANRRAWIPASQTLDRPPEPRLELTARDWDQSGCWVKPMPAPAPAGMICVNDGSGVFWLVGDRKIEQATRAGAEAVAEELYGSTMPVIALGRAYGRFSKRRRRRTRRGRM